MRNELYSIQNLFNTFLRCTSLLRTYILLLLVHTARAYIYVFSKGENKKRYFLVHRERRLREIVNG